MDKSGKPRWAPLAVIAGAFAICCAALPVLALAIAGAGGAAALLTGVLWMAVGGGAIAATLVILYAALSKK